VPDGAPSRSTRSRDGRRRDFDISNSIPLRIWPASAATCSRPSVQSSGSVPVTSCCSRRRVKGARR
jgi:hypothetical protein